LKMRTLPKEKACAPLSKNKFFFSKFSEVKLYKYVKVRILSKLRKYVKVRIRFTFEDVYGVCARSVVSPSCLSHKRARDERKRTEGDERKKARRKRERGRWHRVTEREQEVWEGERARVRVKLSEAHFVQGRTAIREQVSLCTIQKYVIISRTHPHH
jgi:hypothetical protein